MSSRTSVIGSGNGHGEVDGISDSVPQEGPINLDPHWININNILLWISTCDRDHPACGSYHNPCISKITGEAPARPLWLIDTELECIVPAEAVVDEYLALSYVWGGVESGQLTRETIDRFQRPVIFTQSTNPDVVVPKTIRHAMALVRILKKRYLWVDRFCICQDDAATKHSQLQIMGNIYHGAYLTIVAASGWDADHGLTGLKGLTEPRNVSPYMDSHLYADLLDLNYSIWHSRGWTFQEGLFSRRTLIFRYQVVTWGCRSSFWHEGTGISGRYPTPESYKGRIVFYDEAKISSGISVIFRHSDAHNRPVEYYTGLARQYNSRDLTYPEDINDAFLGTMKMFLPSFPRGWWWGLPVQHLNAMLLWQPDSGHSLNRRRAKNSHSAAVAEKIPNWSWMGWEGVVSFRFCIEALTKDWGLHIPILTPLVDWERPIDNIIQRSGTDVRLLRAQAPVARTASLVMRKRITGEDFIFFDGGNEIDCGIIKWNEDGFNPAQMQPLELVGLSSFKANNLRATVSGLRVEDVWLDFFRHVSFSGADFLNIMAVNRCEGIAYRCGLGIMRREKWERLEPRVEDVIIG